MTQDVTATVFVGGPSVGQVIKAMSRPHTTDVAKTANCKTPLKTCNSAAASTVLVSIMTKNVDANRVLIKKTKVVPKSL